MFPFKKILCPTDFSDPSLCGLKMGNEMAERFGSEIIVVNVHKPIPHLPAPRVQASEVTFDVTEYEKHVIEDARDNLAQVSDAIFSDGMVPKLVVRIGKPADEILALAAEEEVDAIFIATHGRTGIANVIFGSVAQRVVRRAACPVLTIRACE
ncbi:MAG: universal stress protein [Candidatus Krumholzibacteriia bacterium]